VYLKINKLSISRNTLDMEIIVQSIITYNYNKYKRQICEMSGNLRHLGHQKPGNQNRQHEGKLRISKNRVRAA